MSSDPVGYLDPVDPPAYPELREWLVRSGDVPADELGITARIESHGLTDRAATDHYGARDLFALAERLHRDLPRPAPAAPGGEERRGGPTVAELLRGATYLIPAVLIVLAYRADTATTRLLWFVALTCVGWGATQALARVAYAAIGRGGVRAAGRYLTWVLAAGAVVATAVGCAVAVAVGSTTLGLVVGAQVGYLALSIVLLPQHREADLLVATAPAAVATVGVVVADVPVTTAAVLVVAGELLVAVVAAARLRHVGAAAETRPDGRDAAEALPFLALGIAAGVLVLGVTAATAEGIGRPGPVVVLAVVLTLCMGVAEVQIAGVRRQLDGALRRSATAAEFTGLARTVLVGHGLGFLAVLVVAEGVAVAVLTDLGAAAAASTAAAVVLLGMCLYLNLCLMVIEDVLPALSAFCGAAALLAVLVRLWDDPGAAAIVVVAVASCGLWLGVRRSVARPYRHAFR